MNGWIGVDLDGTLARYDGWVGITHISDPVPAMQDRVVRWLDQGIDVRISGQKGKSRCGAGPVGVGREEVRRS